MPNFCTRADVYLRAGGEAALSQLIDLDGTGTYSTAILDLAIADSGNFAVAASGVQVELGGMTDAELQERFPELRTVTALMSIALCWDYGTSGRARPEGVQRNWDTGSTMLQQLAERRRKSGSVNYNAAPSQENTRIDIDPDKNRMTLAAWRNTGFG